MSQPTHGGNVVWAAAIAHCSPSEILDFSASISPLGPPPAAMAALQTQLSALHHYPDPTYHQLRSAIAQVHHLDSDWVLPGNGSAELLTWAGRDLAALPATYLPTPAFSDYRRALKAFQSTILECPLQLSQPDQGLAVALAQHQNSRVAGLVLNNPHNPTGYLWSRQSLVPFLDQFALVVVDEAFMDFLPPEHQQSLIDLVPQYPNLIILRSLTKFYSLPGLRLGYAIAHPDRLRCWQIWRDPWSVSVLAEAAAIAVLPDRAFQQQTWNWLEPTRTQLWQALADLPGLHPLPGAANFLLVQSQRPVPLLQQQLLEQHQILIRDCLSFPELGDRYFRVAVRSTADNQRLVAALTDVLSDIS